MFSCGGGKSSVVLLSLGKTSFKKKKRFLVVLVEGDEMSFLHIWRVTRYNTSYKFPMKKDVWAQFNVGSFFFF